MQSHGVEAVDCFAVDNALIKLADPLFLGHCHSHHTDCGELFRPVRLITFLHQNELHVLTFIYWCIELHVEITELCACPCTMLLQLAEWLCGLWMLACWKLLMMSE